MLSVDFYRLIFNNNSAVGFLQRKGIFPTENALPLCSKCLGNVHYYDKSDRIVVRCRSKSCRSEYSIRNFNSFFSFKDSKGRCKSGLTIQSILEIVFCWINESPISIATVTTGHSSKTICDWYNLCREVTVIQFNKREKMGGPGKIIQVDECLLQGKRKAKKGRFRSADLPYERLTDENDLNASNTSRNYGSRLSGQWVVGLVEKLDDNASDARFFIVERRDRGTLHHIIEREVQTGSTIYTDCWLGYNGLSSLGFIHSTVDHSKHFIDPVTGTNTQRIEAIWTRLRLKMVKQMKLSPLIDSHLIEHWYRLKYKQDLFETFLNDIRVNY